MKNLFQDAFIESLDKESNPGIMHLKDIEAKKAGKDSFKLGNKTFPVKEKKKQIEDEGNAFGQAVQNLSLIHI